MLVRHSLIFFLMCRSKVLWDKGCILAWKAEARLFLFPRRLPHQHQPPDLHTLVAVRHHQLSLGEERWRRVCVAEGCLQGVAEGGMTDVCYCSHVDR